MGTRKRKFYREKPVEEPQEEVAQPEEENGEQANEVGMRDMLIGAVVIIIILIVAFLSPNF
ncbi:MAG: hypothetical protein R6U37_01090 [Dehalococcoidia bacterium]